MNVNSGMNCLYIRDGYQESTTSFFRLISAFLNVAQESIFNFGTGNSLRKCHPRKRM